MTSCISAASFVTAYVDPGAGSALFQILIAGFVGMAWAVKAHWKRLVDRFGKKKEDPGPK